MKFPIANTYKRVVKCNYPLDGSEDTVKFEFKAEFKCFTKSELDRLRKESSEGKDDRSTLDVVLVGVHGVEDDAGNPLDPAAAAARVKDDIFLGNATVRAWIDAAGGAQAKN